MAGKNELENDDRSRQIAGFRAAERYKHDDELVLDSYIRNAENSILTSFARSFNLNLSLNLNVVFLGFKEDFLELSLPYLDYKLVHIGKREVLGSDLAPVDTDRALGDHTLAFGRRRYHTRADE